MCEGRPGRKYDAIVFDFDGVLVETMDIKARAFADLYGPYGPVIVDQVVAFHHAHGGMSRYDKIRHLHQHLLGQTVSAAELADLASAFSRMVEEAVSQSAWVPGAREFLQRAHTHLPLFVASATPQEELLRIMQRRDMLRYFRTVFGSPTTKEAAIRQVIHQYRLAPQRVLVIGDAMADMTAAHTAGTQFVGRLAPDSEPLFPAFIPTIPNLESLSAVLAQS